MEEQLNRNTEYYKICRSTILPFNTPLHTNDFIKNSEQSNKKISSEELFERYRLNYCPDKPSRENFFICSKLDVPMWIKKLTRGRGPLKVFRLELTGKVFWADSTYYDQEPNPSKYWAGCSKDDKEAVIEGIFIGEVKAIEDCTNQFKFP